MKRRAAQRFAWGRLTALLLLAIAFLCARGVRAQAHDDAMSEAEIETLRDNAFVPSDRLGAYVKILDARQKRLADLLAKRRHVGFGDDVHDVLDQMAAVADELNDNLDEYRAKHRDVRKAIPLLLRASDKWLATINGTPADDDAYKIVRKLAIDSIEDARKQIKEMQPELEAYFKDHPEAAKAERERADRAAEEAGARRH